MERGDFRREIPATPVLPATYDGDFRQQGAPLVICQGNDRGQRQRGRAIIAGTAALLTGSQRQILSGSCARLRKRLGVVRRQMTIHQHIVTATRLSGRGTQHLKHE